MDEVETRHQRLGIETYKIDKNTYITSGCENCNPQSIIEYCFNCDTLYVRRFKGDGGYVDVDVSLQEIYEFLMSKDKHLQEELESD